MAAALRPLDGIRVLDLSRVLAGPWCTQLLADLGADVIKIERPGAGDDTRHWGPPWHEHRDEKVAAYFLAANRGKKSAAIDFAKPEGAALVRQLAEASDIVVENFKVGGLTKFGLDAGTLRTANARLIYCSITGFGQDGPYAERPGYDYIIQGMGGMMSITGLPDGEPGGGPMRAGVAIVDLFTGLYASNAILAALHRREATGEGATVDLSLFETQLAMLANQASNALISGTDPIRQGNTHPNIVPYQPFDTADQPIIIAVGNDRQFARLAEMLAAPEWVTDRRFASNGARVAHRAELIPLIAERVRAKPAAEWLAQLETAGIPGGPINRISQALADPQAQSRKTVRDIGSGRLGAVPTVGSPLRFDGERADADLPPPALGEHTAEVLEGIGLDSDDIARLRETGIIG